MTPNNKTKTYSYVYLLVILTCFVAAFWPKIQTMVQQWSGGDNNYAYLVMPLFIYLCWDMRSRFDFKTFSWSYWGLLPIAMALLMMMAGELASVITLIFIGIWLCVVGIFVSLYGLRVRQLVFPLLILMFMVPLPPFVNNMLTFQLKLAASYLSVEMMRAVGTSVVLTGNIIDLGVRQLQVVDACSGLRYFVSMILMAFLIGYFFSRGWWRRLVLVALVPPLTVLVNALRIFITGQLTVAGYEKLADSLFHDFSGLVIFILAGAILMGVAMGLNRINKKPLPKPAAFPELEPQGKGKPLALTMLMCLLFVAGGVALKTVPAISKTQQRMLFTEFPSTIGSWQGQRQYLSQEIMDSLWADDYVSATYRHPQSPNPVHLFIPFYSYQATRHTAHAPQACMLGGGWTMKNVEDRSISLKGGRTITLRTMIWENHGSRLLGSYFFLMRGRVITSPWMNKLYLMWDAFTRRRTDGALVRIEIPINEGQDIEAVHKVLETFLGEIWPLLPAYVPG